VSVQARKQEIPRHQKVRKMPRLELKKKLKKRKLKNPHPSKNQKKKRRKKKRKKKKRKKKKKRRRKKNKNPPHSPLKKLLERPFPVKTKALLFSLSIMIYVYI
jgi:hypothetical protein